MSVVHRNPQRLAMANLDSGSVDTGRLPYTEAGTQYAVIWSGGLAPATGGRLSTIASGNQVLLFSGGGSLDSVVPHRQMQSGQPVYFYDAASLAASGVGISGMLILGRVPPTHNEGAWSGLALQEWRHRLIFSTPFYSGLCASAPSGAPGFTVTWTPEPRGVASGTPLPPSPDLA